MKSAIARLAAIFLFVSGIACAQGAADAGAVEREIRRLDQMEADAVLRADFATLDELWAKDFTVNTPNNDVSDGTRGRVRRGDVSYSSFVRVAEAVLVRGDVVIVMGRETVVPKAPTPNAGKTIHRRYTNIWMKRDGEWHLSARHANVIASR
jgi:ketosteroid isomerase-like protein